MPDIDVYLRGVLGKGGEELYLESGKAPQSRAGDKEADLAGDPLSAEKIESLLSDIVPPRRLKEASFRFQYSAAFGHFRGAVARGEDGIKAVVRKAALSEPELPEGAVTPSAPPEPVQPEPAADLAAAEDEDALSAVDAVEPEPAPVPKASPSKPQAPAPKVPPAAPPKPAPAAQPAPRPKTPPPPPAGPRPAPAPIAAEIPQQIPVAAIPQAVGPVVVAPARPPYPPMLAIPRAKPGEAPPINRLLEEMVRARASDLHLSSSIKPMIRLDGSMMDMPGQNPLTPAQVWQLLGPIIPERNFNEFNESRDTDFAYEIANVGRFRCNVFMDRKGPGGVFRTIPTKVLTADDLHLPDAVRMFSSLSKGLVLVTGPTGSGKSTTLAALLDLVNMTRNEHIITIEDPIEFIHENKKCLVNQREVHSHTDGFKHALRAALREDPDIVLVGEMRDLETIEIAIETAETGHLVFGTLHTTTAASTVNRIIEQFPADRQEQIRMMLSDSLKGVVSQTLCKKVGGGRVAALEILLINSAVANLIREKKTHQILSVQQTGKAEGMTLLSEVLAEYVKKGIVDGREGYIKAVDKKGFLIALENLKFNVQGLMNQLAHLRDL